METMNIYALKGHKIRFTGKGGYDMPNKFANELLTIGNIYTVEKTFVSQSSTSVYIQEMPFAPNGRELGLNSVMFEDVEPQSEEDDKKSDQYYNYK